MKPYYQTLGVEETASQEEIKKAYRILSKENHPDKSLEKDSEQRQAAINEAYSILGDAKKRAFYDETGIASNVNIDQRAHAKVNEVFRGILKTRCNVDEMFCIAKDALGDVIEKLEFEKEKEQNRIKNINSRIKELYSIKQKKVRKGMVHLELAIDDEIKELKTKLSSTSLQQLELELLVHKKAFDVIKKDYPAEKEKPKDDSWPNLGGLNRYDPFGRGNASSFNDLMKDFLNGRGRGKKGGPFGY